MACPLCGSRRARRACPALGHEICAVCCGTKRLVQIACPSDCGYLAASREHPPAALIRRQQHDLAALARVMRDLNDRQSRIFFLLVTFLGRYEAPEIQPLIDEDVADAAAALASTFETASRGVIYEHRPAALSAERLANGLKALLAEAGQHGGGGFERDAAVVLRRAETAVREARQEAAGNRRAFLDLIDRVLRQQENEATEGETPREAPRVIIP